MSSLQMFLALQTSILFDDLFLCSSAKIKLGYGARLGRLSPLENITQLPPDQEFTEKRVLNVNIRWNNEKNTLWNGILGFMILKHKTKQNQKASRVVFWHTPLITKSCLLGFI